MVLFQGVVWVALLELVIFQQTIFRKYVTLLSVKWVGLSCLKEFNFCHTVVCNSTPSRCTILAQVLLLCILLGIQ